MLDVDEYSHFGITARPQDVVGVREQCGDADCSSALIHLAIGKIKRSQTRIRRAVRQHKLDPQSLLIRSRTCFRRESFSESEILRLSHREINFDWVDSRYRSHGSGGRTDESTHLELRLACNAIDRCDEPGELEVDPRRFDGSLRSLNLGFGSFHACYGGEIVLNRVVEILLGSSLLSGQRSVPLDIKLSAALYGFDVGKLSFGLR